MKNFCLIIGLILFSFLTVNGQTKKENKLRNNFTMGWGLLSFQQSVYPFQTQYILKYKMKTKLIYHIKYSYEFYHSEDILWEIGFSINRIKYQDFYITSYNFSQPRLDTTHLIFSSTSYLVRNNINYITDIENLNLFCGFGIGYRTPKIKNAIRSSIDTLGNYTTYSLEDPGNDTKLGLEITAGFKYYINPHLGFYVECGLAKSLIQLGIVGRF